MKKVVFALAAGCAVAVSSAAWADKAPPKPKVSNRPVAAAPGAAAGDHVLKEYGSVPGWDIYVDPDAGNGCLAVAEFTDNSVVYIGIDNTTGDGYVTSLNPAWSDIEDGAVYPVTLSLDDNVYEGEATGLTVDDMPGADVVLGDADFFGDIMTAQSLALAHDGAEVMKVDLTGAPEAMKAMIACQDAQDAAN